MTKYLITNWKQQLNLKQSLTLAEKVKNFKLKKNWHLVISPDFPFILEVLKVLKNSKVKLAAQDLSLFKTDYVIIGHSSLKESAKVVNEKLKKVFKTKALPILCFGENLKERKQKNWQQVLEKKLKERLNRIILKDKKIILAYEPIWAIGGSKTIEVEDLNLVYKIVNRFLNKKVGKNWQKQIKFSYGGSVDYKNIDKFLSLNFLDAFLVGGASQEFSSLKKIIDKINKI